MNKYGLSICIIVISAALGYAIGYSSSAQSCQTKQICQCEEDCKCCASCSCSHGEK